MTTMTGKTAARPIVDLDCRGAESVLPNAPATNRQLIAAYEEHIDATHHEAARSRSASRLATGAAVILGAACLGGTWWSTRTITSQRSEISTILGERDAARAELADASTMIDVQEKALDELQVALTYTRAQRDAERPLIDERDRLLSELIAAREALALRGVRPSAHALSAREEPEPSAAFVPAATPVRAPIRRSAAAPVRTDANRPESGALVMFPFKTE